MDPAYPSAELLGLAELHVQRMPSIFSRGRKMSAWTDVKEILFPSCSDKHCVIVLDVLKHALSYPESEADLRPCSAKEHLMFLRQFRVVPTGTLLVSADVIVKKIKELWRIVLLKHCQTRNANSRRCYYAAGDSKQIGKSSKIHLCAKDETAEGDIHLTIFRFANPKHVNARGIDSKIPKFVNVPAVKWKNKATEIKDINEAYGALIPLYCLNECLPNMKDKLVEIAGNHLIHGPETSKHLLTRCCTDQEGRAITRWFHKVFGWGGSWQHLTSRDLLVSWEELLVRDDSFKTSLDGKVEENYKITDQDEGRYVQSVQERDHTKIPTLTSHSTPCLTLNDLSNLSVGDSFVNVTKIADNIDFFSDNCPQKQPKKRPRIKSPEEPSNSQIKEANASEIQKNNSALPNKTSTGGGPIILTTKIPLDIKESKRVPSNCSNKQYKHGNYSMNETRKQQVSYSNFYQNTVPKGVGPVYIPIINPTMLLSHQVLPSAFNSIERPQCSVKTPQYTSIIRRSDPRGQLNANTKFVHKGPVDQEPKLRSELTKSAINPKEKTAINVINQHDVVGSILKSAQLKDNHFKACASVPSRDPRIATIPVQKNEFRAIPYDTRSISPSAHFSKELQKGEDMKENEILDRVSANPFSQSVESLKANRTLHLRNDQATAVIQNEKPSGAANNIECKNSTSKEKQTADDNLQVKGESVNFARKKVSQKESKSETEISSRWKKAFNPIKSSSESAVSWKVKSNDLKLTFTKLLDGVHQLKHNQEATIEKTELTSQSVVKCDLKVVKTEDVNVEEIICALQRKSVPKEQRSQQKETNLEDNGFIQSKQSNKQQTSQQKQTIKSQEEDGVQSKSSTKKSHVESKPFPQKKTIEQTDKGSNSDELKKKSSKNPKGKKAPKKKGIDKKEEAQEKYGDQYLEEIKSSSATSSKEKTKTEIKLSLEPLSVEKIKSPVDEIKYKELTSTYDESYEKENNRNSSQVTKILHGVEQGSETTLLDVTKNSVTLDGKLEKENNSKMVLDDCNKSLNASSKDENHDEEEERAFDSYLQKIDDTDDKIKGKVPRKVEECETGPTMNKSNIEIAEDKMEVKNAIVSKACKNSDRMPSPQSFNSAVSHPKKRWMNDFLCKEDVYHQEENDNIVFEDPLSTDKEQSSSDISSSDTQIIQENPYQNTGDSDATEKYGHEFEEYGSSDDLTRITDSMQQKLNEMFIAQTGESQKHTMTDTQNTVKHSTINENIQETIQSANEKQKIKRFEVSKKKVKKGKRTKSLEVNIKVRSNDNVHTFESKKCVSDQKKTGDSFYAESVGTSSSSERKLNSKSVEKIQSSEKISLDKQSKVKGNREDSNEVSQRRKSKTSKSGFVRRSTRYSRSPGSYAENSSSSEQENEESITEATVVKEEKNDKPKKSKQHKASKSKKGGMKQARIKKEEIPESKEELMRIKSTQTHQFIKEQEIIFNKIKRGSSENKKTSDFKTRGHNKNLSIPELSREDNINETEAMQTDTKVMPKLEPEISTFQVGNKFNSHNQSLNAAYGEKDAYDAKNKQDTDVSHSTKMKSSCFLPELKKSFLVNTNGGSVRPTIDFQIQREFNKREKMLDLHEIRYENLCEDDGKANGGLIHHKMFVIPFVLMNGYKCVTVTDATQMFINCKPKCQKPKTVMQKHRGLFKTFCTWEQVYTLDVLYVRKGRRIKTGDMLLRWDILLASFWDVLVAVKAEHLPPNKNKHKCRYDTL